QGPQWSGAAYVFEKIAGTWTQVDKLKSSTPSTGSRFGADVAVSGDRVVVGGPHSLSPPAGQGHVVVYEKIAGQWTEVANLQDHLGEVGDYFGDVIALEGDRLLVGAPEADTTFGPNAGTVLVFERVAGTWTFTDRLGAPGLAGQGAFGASVDIDGSRAIVGARKDDAAGRGNSGAAYVFDDIGGSLALTATLLPPEPVAWYQFGLTTAISGTHALVGTAGDEAHAFEEVAGNWILRGAMRSVPGHDGGGGDFDFAWTLDLEGDVALIGEPRLLPSGQSGSIAVFTWPNYSTSYCTCANGPRCDDPLAGCRNTSGFGGALRACGSSSVAADDLLITAWRMPANQPLVPIMGAGQIQLPFGDGQLCVGSGGVGLFRFPVQMIDNWGQSTIGPGIVAHSQANFGAAGAIQAGSSWNFQFWFRDTQVSPCGGLQTIPKGFNLTDAVQVLFAP
ncbi:MAG: hypothetical protein ACI841_002079, partial [Planctomycetota bacterium]